ncbi:hypothetical protein C4D60_Mb10t23070 [Musa balbisiana]|uniref:PHD finger protein ALFIN-LIKE n=1 Tax=Musa balbisiana TaxID=52838 RepID=A0A4S8IZ68_MUSBA|nr:hypothetical protein C4D60_Mb10t23070 [Musa balbisiana]
MDLNEKRFSSWTIDMLFRDFLGRRAGLIKALTTGLSFLSVFLEVLAALVVLDPFPKKPYMCLYWYPNENWEVKEAPVVPHEFPEPSLGVNFDKGLLSRLFNMINSNPTIYEVVFGTVKMPKTLRKSNEGESGSKRFKTTNSGVASASNRIEKEEDDDDDVELYSMVDDTSSIICGACGNRFAFRESWIFCNVCVTWYHGRCVKTTPEQYERLKDYRCPRCCRQKRART